MVKIREARPQRRTALLSLMAAALVAGGTFAGWRMYHRGEPPPARQREITDLTFTWQCESGERFEAAGAYGPQPCKGGSGSADIVLRAACPEHGSFECRVRYRREAPGVSRLASVRFARGDWQPVQDALRCPTCSRVAQVQGGDPWPGSEKAAGR